MGPFRVVCTTQEPINLPVSHRHIVAVGTGSDPDKYTDRWTLAQVITAIESGTVFFTVSPSTGAVALVQVVSCWHCNRKIIRSAADAVTDNNLDNLRFCRS